MKLKQYPNCSVRFYVKKIFLVGVMAQFCIKIPFFMHFPNINKKGNFFPLDWFFIILGGGGGGFGGSQTLPFGPP